MKPGNPANHRITGLDHPATTDKPGAHHPRSETDSPGFRLPGSGFALVPTHRMVQQPKLHEGTVR